MLRTLGVDVDHRRLFGRVVFADFLDGTTIALGAGVYHDDTVKGRTDLAHALQSNLDSHVWVSPHSCLGERRTPRGETRADANTAKWTRRAAERGPRPMSTPSLCQMPATGPNRRVPIAPNLRYEEGNN